MTSQDQFEQEFVIFDRILTNLPAQANEIFHQNNKITEICIYLAQNSILIKSLLTQLAEVPFNSLIHTVNLKFHIDQPWHVQKLIQKLSASCRFLTTLILQNKCLGNQTASIIMRADWKFITKLSLRDNNITHEGVQKLMKFEWNFLNEFDISKNPIGNKGIGHISKTKWPSLQEIYVYEINATGDGMKVFTKLVAPKLNKINIGLATISGKQINQLVNSKFYNCKDILFYQQNQNQLSFVNHFAKFANIHKKNQCNLIVGQCFRLQSQRNQLSVLKKLINLYVW